MALSEKFKIGMTVRLKSGEIEGDPRYSRPSYCDNDMKKYKSWAEITDLSFGATATVIDIDEDAGILSLALTKATWDHEQTFQYKAGYTHNYLPQGWEPV